MVPSDEALLLDQNAQQLAQLRVYFRFGVHRSSHLSPQHLAITRAQPGNMTADRRFGDGQVRRQVGVSRQGIGADRQETAKFLEQVFFPFGFVSRLQPAQRGLHQGLRPRFFKQGVFPDCTRIGRDVGLEE
jgi:hypothetical protein